MSFKIGLPTAALSAPAGGATVELFNSVTAFGAGVLSFLPLKRIQFSAEHDQTFVLNGYRSTNGGTNWDQTFTQSLPVVANTIAGPIDVLIDGFSDFKLEAVNGGTPQGTWRPELRGIEDTRNPGN